MVKRIFCYLGILLALGYNIWISFRVLDDWMGFAGAAIGVIIFPITTIVLPVAMFFIPSDAAGSLALWPGIAVVGTLYGVLNKVLGVEDMKNSVSLLSKIFGYRWSLYICKNDQAIYAMHENSVIRIVGYVMGCFADGKTPIAPWALHLNFNKTHKAFKLIPEHFTSDGENITPRLISDIEAIDPGYRVKSAEPIFFEISTKKKLPIRAGARRGMAHAWPMREQIIPIYRP